ncbi:DUF1573 domain-containing protein [Arachidicoccus sp.]|uniref:DUF1573 domain-containing protein n=1 Tax=Arachidicoccus sp. TaxID=1872624 RepID=UPI003D202862
MNKLFAFLTTIALIGLLSCSGNSTTTHQKQPAGVSSDTANFTQIKWLDSIHDFGSVKYGENVAISYTFKNIGQKPLYITSVRPTCGCTIADYTKDAVLPGQEGTVKATFDSKHGAPGSIRKSIVVSSNTTNDANYVLAFTGTVTK